MEWVTALAALASLAYGVWQAFQRRRVTKRLGDFHAAEQELAAAMATGDVERLNTAAHRLRDLRQQTRLSP